MVSFKDFMFGMSKSGFVSSERIDDSLFQYKLPVARSWIEALRYNYQGLWVGAAKKAIIVSALRKIAGVRITVRV